MTSTPGTGDVLNDITRIISILNQHRIQYQRIPSVAIARTKIQTMTVVGLITSNDENSLYHNLYCHILEMMSLSRLRVLNEKLQMLKPSDLKERISKFKTHLIDLASTIESIPIDLLIGEISKREPNLTTHYKKNVTKFNDYMKKAKEMLDLVLTGKTVSREVYLINTEEEEELRVPKRINLIRNNGTKRGIDPFCEYYEKIIHMETIYIQGFDDTLYTTSLEFGFENLCILLGFNVPDSSKGRENIELASGYFKPLRKVESSIDFSSKKIKKVTLTNQPLYTYSNKDNNTEPETIIVPVSIFKKLILPKRLSNGTFYNNIYWPMYVPIGVYCALNDELYKLPLVCLISLKGLNVIKDTKLCNVKLSWDIGKNTLMLVSSSTNGELRLNTPIQLCPWSFPVEPVIVHQLRQIMPLKSVPKLDVIEKDVVVKTTKWKPVLQNYYQEPELLSLTYDIARDGKDLAKISEDTQYVLVNPGSEITDLQSQSILTLLSYSSDVFASIGDVQITTTTTTTTTSTATPVITTKQSSIGLEPTMISYHFIELSLQNEVVIKNDIELSKNQRENLPDKFNLQFQKVIIPNGIKKNQQQDLTIIEPGTILAEVFGIIRKVPKDTNKSFYPLYGQEIKLFQRNNKTIELVNYNISTKQFDTFKKKVIKHVSSILDNDYKIILDFSVLGNLASQVQDFRDVDENQFLKNRRQYFYTIISSLGSRNKHPFYKNDINNFEESEKISGNIRSQQESAVIIEEIIQTFGNDREMQFLLEIISNLYCKVDVLKKRPTAGIIESISLSDGKLHHHLVALKQLIPGDVITIDKNDNESSYWEWRCKYAESEMKECGNLHPFDMAFAIGIALNNISAAMVTLDSMSITDRVDQTTKIDYTEQFISNSLNVLDASSEMVANYLKAIKNSGKLSVLDSIREKQTEYATELLKKQTLLQKTPIKKIGVNVDHVKAFKILHSTI